MDIELKRVTVSILGPTNIEKCAARIGSTPDALRATGADVGKAIAASGALLRVVFNYSGMLAVVGDAHQQSGGTMEMLYTNNDADWAVDEYRHYRDGVARTKEYPSWHDMLLSLVRDSDVLVCAGISAGVMVELGYFKWDVQEQKGSVRALVGIRELLPNGRFPSEYDDLHEKMQIVSASELSAVLKKL